MKFYNDLISPEIGYTLGALFSVLSICLTLFYLRKNRKGDAFSNELFLRTRS